MEDCREYEEYLKNLRECKTKIETEISKFWVIKPKNEHFFGKREYMIYNPVNAGKNDCTIIINPFYLETKENKSQITDAINFVKSASVTIPCSAREKYCNVFSYDEASASIWCHLSYVGGDVFELEHDEYFTESTKDHVVTKMLIHRNACNKILEHLLQIVNEGKTKCSLISMNDNILKLLRDCKSQLDQQISQLWTIRRNKLLIYNPIYLSKTGYAYVDNEIEISPCIFDVRTNNDISIANAISYVKSAVIPASTHTPSDEITVFSYEDQSKESRMHCTLRYIGEDLFELYHFQYCHDGTGNFLIKILIHRNQCIDILETLKARD